MFEQNQLHQVYIMVYSIIHGSINWIIKKMKKHINIFFKTTCIPSTDNI